MGSIMAVDDFRGPRRIVAPPTDLEGILQASLQEDDQGSP
jgi:hypothetical protein